MKDGKVASSNDMKLMNYWIEKSTLFSNRIAQRIFLIKMDNDISVTVTGPYVSILELMEL